MYLNNNDIKSIDRAKSWLDFIKNEGDSIFRIVELVQDNPDFFDATIGVSCMEKAASKLKGAYFQSRQ